MKKSISLFLIVAMLFSMSSVAFAADNVQMEPELFEEYAVDTGIFYRYTLDYVGDEWDAIIFVPNDGSSVSFSATKITPLVEGELDEADDGIYSVTIEAGANKEPLEYLREGFSLLNQASVVSASTFDTNTVEQRDSVQADLFAAARKIYGNEYERVVYNDYTYPNVDVISVHGDLTLRMRKEGSKTFEVGTSLSVAALALTKMTGVSVTLSFLSLVVSVRGEIIDTLAVVDAYVVDVDFGRWTTVDNGDYVYTIANKIYQHCGLNERNNETKAYLQDEEPELLYMPSPTYYNDYSAQVEDAYNMYLGLNK